MSAIPRRVEQKILNRCGKGEPLVVIPRDGKPAIVYGLAEYLKMKRLASRHKPWTKRRRAKVPDPLGAIDGRVISPLGRKYIYD